MEITNKKWCPKCGSRNLTFLGLWGKAKEEHDVPNGDFLETDHVYQCNGSECDIIFIVRNRD